MMKRGDQVEVLDDTIKGVIVEISTNSFIIEDTDGFRIEVEQSQVVPTKPLDITTDSPEVYRKIKADLSSKKTHSKKVLREVKAIEVDLHIHELTDKSKHMSNLDMLNLQLDTARHRLESAIKNNQKKIVFIHGVGEGVLKQELDTLFRRYDQIDFYDADFKIYGFGATEVYIYQN